MWLFLAILAGIIYAIQILLARAHLRTGTDSWIIPFYVSSCSVLLLLSVFLLNKNLFTVSISLLPFILLTWFIALIQ